MEISKKEYSVWGILKKLSTLARMHMLAYLTICILILISGGLGVLEAEAFRRIVDSSIIADNHQLKIGIILGLIAVVFGSLIKFIIDVMKNILNLKSTLALQANMVEKLFDIKFAEYKKFHSADLIARINDSAPTTQGGINEQVINFFNNVVIVVSLMIYLFYLNRLLTFGILVLIIVIPLMINPLAAKLRGYYDEIQQDRALYEGFIQESVQGAELIKLNSLQQEFNFRLKRLLGKYLKLNKKSIFIESVVNQSHTLVYILSFIFILGCGGFLVLQNELDIGAIVAFIVAFNRLLGPLSSFLDIWPRFQQSISAGRRVFSVLDLPTDDKKTEELNDTSELENHPLQIKNLSFTYSNEEEADYILKNINFVVKKDKITVLTGQSGSGKSTLLKLILKFYQHSDGQILLNNQSTQSLTEWRKAIGFVSQEPFIFTASVYDNIVFGNQTITLDEIITITKNLNIHEKICGLERGYDTKLSGNGIELSGGERQLICIARALVRKPTIILLDEPTAALDTYNQKIVNQAIRNISDQSTILIVSHNKYMIEHADEIIVLKDGEIVID